MSKARLIGECTIESIGLSGAMVTVPWAWKKYHCSFYIPLYGREMRGILQDRVLPEYVYAVACEIATFLLLGGK